MWPPPPVSVTSQSSIQPPMLPPSSVAPLCGSQVPPPPPPPPPPLPLSMLLRCFAPTSFELPSQRWMNEISGCPQIPLPGRMDSVLDIPFPYFLHPSKMFLPGNELEINQGSRSQSSEECAIIRKAKRPPKSPRGDSDNASTSTSGGGGGSSKKCKKISATAQTDSNEHIEDIRRFARAFKMKRLSLGLTQTQIGRALTAGDGPAYSQSAICRFEKLDITPKSAQRIKPVLERWLAELEGRRIGDPISTSTSASMGPAHASTGLCEASGSSTNSICDLGSQDEIGICRADCESDESYAGIRKRKSRTNFSADALDRLNQEFNINMHPSGTRISQLANQLNYDREVIRVWFCNKRQSFRNSRVGDQQPSWMPFQAAALCASDRDAPIDLSTKAPKVD